MSHVVDFSGARHAHGQRFDVGGELRRDRARGDHVGDREPMVAAGAPDIRVSDHYWTVVTRDASLSAQVEHTVTLTNDGSRVLTA